MFAEVVIVGCLGLLFTFLTVSLMSGSFGSVSCKSLCLCLLVGLVCTGGVVGGVQFYCSGSLPDEEVIGVLDGVLLVESGYSRVIVSGKTYYVADVIVDGSLDDLLGQFVNVSLVGRVRGHDHSGFDGGVATITKVGGVD